MTSLQELVGALSVLLRVAGIVAMFLLLIVPHEAGHFTFAKLFGVPVYEFSVGMGTRLWSAVRSGTLYALRLIPIGGYVRLAGMEPGDYHAPDGFHSKRSYQRILILLAGPLANFLVATVIMTGVSLARVNDDPGKVVGVYRDTPAWTAGIRPGDSIRSVDGQALRSSTDLRQIKDRKVGQPLDIVIRRQDGSSFATTITPVYESRWQQYMIGVETQPIITPPQALVVGITFPAVATAVIGDGVYRVLSGEIPGGLLGPAGLSGPIGFSYVTYDFAGRGLIDYLTIAALLSMALGLTNLLPIPALDGGRILVAVLEKLRGRPFDREREMAVQRAGLLALLALMAVIAILDVQRISSGQFVLR